MKVRIHILFFLLFLSINLSAQIVYDTIPDGFKWIGGFHDLPVFNNFEHQAIVYFDKVDFKNLDCYGEKAEVSAIFGKTGDLELTKIIKSASPMCDSIAFYFVSGLKDWLPGSSGRFGDVSFTFTLPFDSIEIKNSTSRDAVILNATDEEYNKRKECFDFVISEEYDQQIINQYDFFKEYIADVFRVDEYVYITTDYKLKKNESIVLEITNHNSKDIHLLISDSQKNWILYEYTIRNGKVRIPKDKNLFLLFYQEQFVPFLQSMIIYSDIDTTLELKLEEYTKGRLLDEIRKYKP